MILHAAETETTRETALDPISSLFRGDDVEPTQLSPKRVAEVLNIDIQTLARQARVHRNTITRAPGCATVQEYLRTVARVIAAAFDVSGDLERAIGWYMNEPISDYRYRTAQSLVAEGHAEAVLSFIESLHDGAAG